MEIREYLQASKLNNTFRTIVRRNRRYLSLEIALLVSLGIAAAVFGPHLFDASVPVQGDVRAHIFKIDIFHQHLSQLSWPGWTPWWYEGIPLNQYYPPGYYLIGAVLTFITGQAVIAYKIMMLLTMAACGLSAYFFMRSFLRTSPVFALLALLAYEVSVPLLLNFTMGEGPNLLGWSLALVFLTFYLKYATEGDMSGLQRRLLPGILLGVTILVHPFPAVFAVLAVGLYHLVRFIHFRSVGYQLRQQFVYVAMTMGLAAFIGAYYWVPLLLTLEYASPIYGFTEFQWSGGARYLIAVSIIALFMGVVARFKAEPQARLRFDFLILTLALAVALGSGLARFFPLGLGSFLQDFRFDTIIAPFFGFVLIAHSLDYYLSYRIRTRNLLLALAGGAVVSIVVIVAEAFQADGTQARFLEVLNSQGVLTFLLLLFPVAVLLVLLAFQTSSSRPGKTHPVPAIAVGVCLLMLSTALPYFQTRSALGLGRLFTYTDNYLGRQYDDLMNTVQGSRLVVPMVKGYLVEGDNPVTFGWRWGVETVNGPYNQGDPNFFLYSVHLEWEQRWLEYQHTRENLLQEAGAGYIFTRYNLNVADDETQLDLVASNSYGRIYALDAAVARAVGVTPVILDVRDPRAVTEFFNILVPGGYRMVFVTADTVDSSLLSQFEYVMTDDPDKLADYPGQRGILLANSSKTGVSDEGAYTALSAPFRRIANRYFYHGDEANVYMWLGTDAWQGSRLTEDDLALLKEFGASIAPFLDGLAYEPAEYAYDDNRIELASQPGFTLVKDSYFPYWQSDDAELIRTTQGFMLVASPEDEVTLDYWAPLPDKLATAATITGLTGAVALGTVLVIRRFRRIG